MCLYDRKRRISRNFRKEETIDMVCRSFCGLKDLHIPIPTIAYKFGFTQLSKIYCIIPELGATYQAAETTQVGQSWAELASLSPFPAREEVRVVRCVSFAVLPRPQSCITILAGTSSKQKLLRYLVQYCRDDDSGLSGGVPLQAKCPQ